MLVDVLCGRFKNIGVDTCRSYLSSYSARRARTPSKMLLRNPSHVREPFFGRNGVENAVATNRFCLAFQLKSSSISNENVML